jgi:preprotein translocase subunit SecF
MVKLMERKKIWFLVSAILLVPGIISLIVWKLHLGIEFKGGSLSEYSVKLSENSQTAESSGKEAIAQIYKDVGVAIVQNDASLNADKEIHYFVKSPSMAEGKHRDIVRRLNEHTPPIQELSFESIDPQVGSDVTRKALLAIVVASIAIIGYIALSFRGVPKPASSWQFGIIAVVALLHDVFFILGFYSLMGHFLGWEVTTEFVTAVLTVMGFSVHDTIVVFDRLRENLKRYPSDSFTDVANISVTQTISRSLNTSLTVLLVLLALALLGGTHIRPFAITLLVGIAMGTYSSIFVATPLLEWWQTARKPKRLKFPSLRGMKMTKQSSH